MNRVLLCLLAFAACACNPFPKTEAEIEKAEVAKEKAVAQAKPTATPRKPGDWIYDNQKERLTKDKDKKGNWVNPLAGSPAPQGSPKKDDRYSNPLDKKPK